MNKVKSMQLLSHVFKRVLIESSNTKLAVDYDQGITDELVSIIGDRCDSSEFIVISFMSIDCWLVVALSEIYWMNQGELNTLTVDNLKQANLDLSVNKKLGFNSEVGFKYLTLISKNDKRFDIEVEPGSSLVAILSVINRLISMSV